MARLQAPAQQQKAAFHSMGNNGGNTELQRCQTYTHAKRGNIESQHNLVTLSETGTFRYHRNERSGDFAIGKLFIGDPNQVLIVKSELTEYKANKRKK